MFVFVLVAVLKSQSLLNEVFCDFVPYLPVSWYGRPVVAYFSATCGILRHFLSTCWVFFWFVHCLQ